MMYSPTRARLDDEDDNDETTAMFADWRFTSVPCAAALMWAMYM